MTNKKGKNVPCSVWINSDLLELLRWVAYVERISMSAVARSAIERECIRLLEAKESA
jgi:hypothetical protein